MLLAAMGIVALVVGIAASNLSSSVLLGAALAAALFAVLLQWPARRLFVQHLLDDWIFARRYLHGEHEFPDRASQGRGTAMQRLRGPAKLMRSWYSAAASVPCSQIDVLNRALRLEPSLGQDGSAMAFISVGSSIPKIGLHQSPHGFERQSSGSRTRLPSSGASTKRSRM